jgi:hypothetical protein
MSPVTNAAATSGTGTCASWTSFSDSPKRGRICFGQGQILHIELGDDANALALDVGPRFHIGCGDDHRTIRRRCRHDHVVDSGGEISDRRRVLIVADVEIADRHHLVGPLVIAAHEVDVDAVFLPELGMFGDERLNVIIARRACHQAHLVIIGLLRQ